MQVQNQIGGTLRANLARLREVLDSTAARGVESIGRVADRVCEAFDFRDGRGRLQRASCRQALAELEAAGQVALPPPRRRGGVLRKPRVLAQPVTPARAVPAAVGGLGDLELVLVESDAQRLIWNTLMAHEHPRGAGPWVGHQLRYLVGSAHGWLGGVGFAASARRLQARDAWIGWDDTGPPQPTAPGGGTVPVSDPPRGVLPQLGFARPGSGGAGSGHGLRAPLRLSALAAGDVR